MKKTLICLFISFFLFSCSFTDESDISKTIDFKEELNCSVKPGDDYVTSNYTLSCKEAFYHKFIYDDIALLSNLLESAKSRGDDKAVAKLTKKVRAAEKASRSNGLFKVTIVNLDKPDIPFSWAENGYHYKVSVIVDDELFDILGYSYKNTDYTFTVIDGEVKY